MNPHPATGGTSAFANGFRTATADKPVDSSVPFDALSFAQGGELVEPEPRIWCTLDGLTSNDLGQV